MSTNQSSRFKQFRTDRGWSQKRMAVEFGVTQPTIAKWEAGAIPPELAVKLLDQYLTSGYGMEDASTAQVVPS